MNYEQIVISLLFHGELIIEECNFIEDMFENKTNYEYTQVLLNAYMIGDKTLEQINQQFLSKKPLNIYDLNFIKSQLSLYNKLTLLELFYKNSIDYIWTKTKLVDTNSSIIDELSLKIENIRNIIANLEKKEEKNPYESFRKQILLTKSKIENGEFSNGIVGLKSGISTIDNITGGFQDGEYIILAGRPSMGKTSLAIDIAIDNVKENKKVLVFSIEMTAEQLVARAIPKINPSLLLKHTVYGEDINSKIDEILEASKFLEKSGLSIEDFSYTSKVTIIEIQKGLEQYYRKNGYYPDLVIVDYIQIIKDHMDRKDENQIITEISSTFQRLGKKTKSVFLVLSQLNRALEERTDKRPLNSDLRGSGSLEQDADKILFVYRDAVYLEKKLVEKLKKNPDSVEVAESLRNLRESTTDLAEVIISKNRNGSTGTANAEFYKPAASYVENASLIYSVGEDLEGF